MNFRRLTGLLALSFLFSAPAFGTSVGPWYEVKIADGNFVITRPSRIHQLPVTVAPYEHLEDHAWIDAIAPHLSTDQTREAVERQYGLLSGDLTAVGSCHRPGVICTSGSQLLSSGSTSNFTTATPFDYLAVRVGISEILFHWTTPTSTFTLAGIPSTMITNYRAFLGPEVIVTPLPAAAVLFGSALLGMLGLGRRKASAASAAA